MKKGGHGTGNWGTIEDELEAQTAEPVLEVPVEKEAPAEQSAAEPEQPAEPEEEVPKTLTLKEYKEQKVKAKVELSTKGARRANDGKNVFSNMVEVHKSKPVEDVLPDVLEEKQEEKVRWFCGLINALLESQTRFLRFLSRWRGWTWSRWTPSVWPWRVPGSWTWWTTFPTEGE